MLQPHTGSLPLLPFPGAGLVLVEDQRWTVDVEEKLLTVDGDKKSPGNVVITGTGWRRYFLTVLYPSFILSMQWCQPTGRGW